jgi:hypothetical protein
VEESIKRALTVGKESCRKASSLREKERGEGVGKESEKSS